VIVYEGRLNQSELVESGLDSGDVGCVQLFTPDAATPLTVLLHAGSAFQGSVVVVTADWDACSAHNRLLGKAKSVHVGQRGSVRLPSTFPRITRALRCSCSCSCSCS